MLRGHGRTNEEGQGESCHDPEAERAGVRELFLSPVFRNVNGNHDARGVEQAGPTNPRSSSCQLPGHDFLVRAGSNRL